LTVLAGETTHAIATTIRASAIAPIAMMNEDPVPRSALLGLARSSDVNWLRGPLSLPTECCLARRTTVRVSCQPRCPATFDRERFSPVAPAHRY